MAEIRWSLRSADDLRDVEDFIARDSPLHAVRTIDQIVESVEPLASFPLMGRVVPEFERDDLRELIYGSYRIVYLLREFDVLVVRVIHGARDIRRIGVREPWDLIE
jgi:toxin ParE1/3/4